MPTTTSPTYAGRFRFTGQTWFPDLELYNYKARFYDPEAGRFLQTDPIGYGDGMNMYAYVGGDPVNGRDPTGTACVDLDDVVVDCSGYKSILRDNSLCWDKYDKCIPCGVQCPGVSNDNGDGWRGTSGEGLGNPYAPGMHGYRKLQPIAKSCSVSDNELKYLVQHFSTPFAPGMAAVNDRVKLWGGNPIQQNISRDGYTVTNQTLPGHAMHSLQGGGTIIRTARVISGDLYIETISSGTNYSSEMGLINQVVGGWIFDYLDGKMAKYVKDKSICD